MRYPSAKKNSWLIDGLSPDTIFLTRSTAANPRVVAAILFCFNVHNALDSY
jgi:hypothetical protein